MNFEGKKLIVATDLSPSSFHALQVGLAWGKALNMKIEVLHAYQDPYKMALSAYDMGALGLSDGQLNQLKSGVGKEVSRQIEKCGQVPRNCQITLLEGEPHEVLKEHCKKTSPGLVVIGLRGHGMWEELFIGSVAKKLIRSADYPILAVHNKAPQLPKNILYASEGLNETSNGFLWAKALAGLGKARLELFHVVNPTNLDDELKSSVESEETSLSIDEALTRYQASVQAKINVLEEKLGGIETESYCVTTKTIDTATLVLQRLEEQKNDLIIMGSHGRKGIKRWLMGSTTEVISERALCSILVVK